MNFKGTKGKWNVEKGNHYFSVRYIENKRGVINLFMLDELCNGSDSLSNECHANALLISKAPEMLQMLEYIENKLRNGYEIQSSDHSKIQQLIKEATEL